VRARGWELPHRYGRPGNAFFYFTPDGLARALAELEEDRAAARRAAARKEALEELAHRHADELERIVEAVLAEQQP